MGFKLMAIDVCAAEEEGAAVPPPLPPPVLTGHVSSITPY